MNQSTLFISYDGLTDPLGSSQIIPYIKIISNSSEAMHVLSFEKENFFNEYSYPKTEANSIDLPKNVFLHPLKFTKNLGVFGKIFDLIKMYFLTINIILGNRINVIHARGHPTALIACSMKAIFLFRKLDYVFDFRGLWVDERVDKGSWNLNNSIHLLQFKIFKYFEKVMLRKASAIVVLTNSMKEELQRLGFKKKYYEVIPCCCDFNKFKINSKQRKLKRALLDIDQKDLLLGYVGSIGSMYRFDKLLTIFQRIANHKKNVFLLFLTNDPLKAKSLFTEFLPSEVFQKVIIKQAGYSEMPDYIATLDLSLFFLNHSYARLGTSPTKFAESLATGVPVICNSGIGDLDNHMANNPFGLSISEEYFNNTSDEEFNTLISNILSIDKFEIRNHAKKIYDLSIANERYSRMYKYLRSK